MRSKEQIITAMLEAPGSNSETALLSINEALIDIRDILNSMRGNQDEALDLIYEDEMEDERETDWVVDYIEDLEDEVDEWAPYMDEFIDVELEDLYTDDEPMGGWEMSWDDLENEYHNPVDLELEALYESELPAVINLGPIFQGGGLE